jgi:membrane protein DedA with SNARE-associated domain
MTEALFGLIPTYGAWILMIATFLSCLAIPVPTSLMMLAGGAFIASGDLNVFSVVAAAWGGAILGDQAGYFVGRSGGAPLLARARNAPRAAEPIARATSYLHRRGGSAVFFSRWLLSPLGPYVNFIGGAGRLRWPVFTLWSGLGEAVWVAIYVALGFAFASRNDAVASVTGNLVGFLATGVVAALLGRVLWVRQRDAPPEA